MQVGYVEYQRPRDLMVRGYLKPSNLTDPYWGLQWSLVSDMYLITYVNLTASFLSQNNTGQLNKTDIGRDLNVERAWLQGLTGCGIVVAIVDNGKTLIHRL